MPVTSTGGHDVRAPSPHRPSSARCNDTKVRKPRNRSRCDQSGAQQPAHRAVACQKSPSVIPSPRNVAGGKRPGGARRAERAAGRRTARRVRNPDRSAPAIVRPSARNRTTTRRRPGIPPAIRKPAANRRRPGRGHAPRPGFRPRRGCRSPARVRPKRPRARAGTGRWGDTPRRRCPARPAPTASSAKLGATAVSSSARPQPRRLQ